MALPPGVWFCKILHVRGKLAREFGLVQRRTRSAACATRSAACAVDLLSHTRMISSDEYEAVEIT